MKSLLTFMIVALLCVTCVSGMALAQLTQTTWQGDVDDDWFEENNWTSGQRPDEGYEAIIPYNPAGGNVWPVIDDDQQVAEAGKLTITVSGATRGSLTIKGQSVLVLGDGNAQTTTINGDVYLGQNGGSDYATLKINGSHVIQGEGGTITMRDFQNTKILENDGTGDYLTLQSSNTSCTGWPADRDCTVLMHGSAEIHVGLDNRAYVVSDDSCLKLKTDAKTGTSAGYWQVENGAEFHVETGVTGACPWEITDLDGGQFIVEDNGCVNATGPVTLNAGELLCYEQFCTSGKLILKSVSKGGGQYTGPRIYVVGGKEAKFGSAVTCGSCP
ncbi:MAG: hypothetical protein IT449_10245 [Phycisphaerales bacterium]|nr:hypothetical protein [Phycisphaerales bacterium]